MAAVAGSAVGGAVVAFLVSWVAFGGGSDDGRVPISLTGPQIEQGELPGAAGVPGSPGSSTYGSQAAPSSPGTQGGRGQMPGSNQGSGGGMPSARSGAS